jgi:7,8-dihydropterin-6-yl-methyl-4-(beta-D-ribofuranosyl)aminobenzene 5'-phosphate synthase
MDVRGLALRSALEYISGMRFRALLSFIAVALAVFAASEARAADIELLNVYDAFGNPPNGAAHDYGFAVVVRYKGKTILFDAGNDADRLEKNLASMKVDPKKIDWAVASHAHNDHIAGFDYLLKVNPKLKIYVPYDYSLGAPITMPLSGPDGDSGASLPPEHKYFAGKFDRAVVKSSGRFWKANVEYISENKEIAPGVHLVVTPSPLMGYFTKYPPYEKEPFLQPLPEISASFTTAQGEVLLVGCSHSTVDNIIQETKTYLKKDPAVVIGGYHLVPYKTDYISALAKRMRETHKIAKVAPAHCSGHTAFKVFRELYGDDYLFFGLGASIKL